MRWLGQVCQIYNSHHLKKLPFASGELVTPKPFHGTNQRWRNVMTADNKTLGVPLDGWHKLTSDKNSLYTE